MPAVRASVAGQQRGCWRTTILAPAHALHSGLRHRTQSKAARPAWRRASALRRFGQACSCYTMRRGQREPNVMDCPRPLPTASPSRSGTPLLRESSGLTELPARRPVVPNDDHISQIHRQRVMQCLLRRKCRAGGESEDCGHGSAGDGLEQCAGQHHDKPPGRSRPSAPGQPSNFRPRCLCTTTASVISMGLNSLPFAGVVVAFGDGVERRRRRSRPDGIVVPWWSNVIGSG